MVVCLIIAIKNYHVDKVGEDLFLLNRYCFEMLHNCLQMKIRNEISKLKLGQNEMEITKQDISLTSDSWALFIPGRVATL